MMSENAAVDLFFNLVSKRSESTGFKSCPELLLPHTVVYTATVPSGWFACTSEADMIIREGNKVKPAKVYDAFLETDVAPLQRITSTLISVQDKEAKVSYFTKEELRDYLFRQSKPALGLLQRWHGSPTGRTRSFRVDYSPDLVQTEMRTNNHYKAASLEVESLLTYDGAEYQASTEPVSSDLPRKKLKKTVEAICGHILTTSQLQVARMVLHFTQDERSNLWLQFCSCLRLRSPSGAFIGQPRPFRFALYKKKVVYIGQCGSCGKAVQDKLYDWKTQAVCDVCFILVTSVIPASAAAAASAVVADPASRTGSLGKSSLRGLSSGTGGLSSRASSVQGGLDQWLRHKAAAISSLISVDVFSLVKEVGNLAAFSATDKLTHSVAPELLEAAQRFTAEGHGVSTKDAASRKKKDEARMRSKLASLGLKLSLENGKFQKLSLEDEVAAMEAEAKRKELLRLQRSGAAILRPSSAYARTRTESDAYHQGGRFPCLQERLQQTRRILSLDQRQACMSRLSSAG